MAPERITSEIEQKLSRYKKKFFLNLAWKGLLISVTFLAASYLVVNGLEYTFRFASAVRAVLFFAFCAAGIWALWYWIIHPLYRYLNYKEFDDELAARQIGRFYPNISDRLLNIIQLQRTGKDNTLAQAGIYQKATQVLNYNYDQAIDWSGNYKYLRYAGFSILAIVIIALLSPAFFTSSTERLVKFNREFVPEAPFTFKLKSNELTAFRNEDFTLEVELSGTSLPEDVYLSINDRRFKLVKESSNTFSYKFQKIQNSKVFSLNAAGFSSNEYNINVVSRPELGSFNVTLDYPTYVGRENESLVNVGNLQVPAGTSVLWQLQTLQANSVQFKFSSEEEIKSAQLSENQIYEYEKTVLENTQYSLLLENEFSPNKSPINFTIDVIPDQYPEISAEVYEDTVFYSFVAISGDISDDYGLRSLNLYYKSSENNSYNKVSLPINRNQNTQHYYYQWAIDSFKIDKGNVLEYYLETRDNDGIQGSKASKTRLFRFQLPDKQQIKDKIAKQAEDTEEDIDKTLKRAEELKEDLEDAERKLKGQKNLNWQNENQLKDILRKREDLNEALEKLKEQNQMLNEQRNRFSEQDQRIQEKVEQLQQLMEDLLDEETKKLYEELQRLLEENQNMNEIQNTLEQLNNRENNLEKEIERALELFKRMQLEQNLNAAIEDLEEQVEEQENLLEETKQAEEENAENSDNASEKEQNPENEQGSENENNKNSNEKNNKLSEKQEQLQEKFEKLEEELEKLQEENQELKNPQSLPDTQEEQESIKEEQQKSSESLRNNQKQKSQQSQQKAKEQMQQMKEKMEQMQSSMGMQMMQQNLGDLRAIVHNLLKLSFDQEDLMNEFVDVSQSDPRFVELSQKQLKLKDDAQIVEDSLMSLAKRVFQVSSFVTREVTEMNKHMDKSMEAIRERKKPMAVSEQQFAMTSMNNLALLLDDVLQQMQQAMADAMGTGQQNKQEGQTPSLSQLQQQLNNQINDLKESGKSGRQLSEELARLAAEQERIRKAMEEMREKLGLDEGGSQPGNQLSEKMEETESDLVNKRLTQETIERQKEILTRLLEAEDAMRERELDEERKGEAAKDYTKELPKAFEEYFRLKEKEIELLKTVPPKLYPYYKKEVSEYFRRLDQNLKQ